MTRSWFATFAVATALAGALLAGCGRSSPAISDDASRQLQLQAAAVRNLAAARDRAGADEALAELRRTAAELRAREEISEDRYAEVLNAAATVERELQSIPTTTTTTTTTTTPSPPRDRDDDQRDRPGKNGGQKGGPKDD